MILFELPFVINDKHNRLMDVKQGQNKEGKTVLYLVFEYMDTDLKKFIRSFRQSGECIPSKIVKVGYDLLLVCNKFPAKNISVRFS